MSAVVRSSIVDRVSGVARVLGAVCLLLGVAACGDEEDGSNLNRVVTLCEAIDSVSRGQSPGSLGSLRAEADDLRQDSSGSARDYLERIDFLLAGAESLEDAPFDTRAVCNEVLDEAYDRVPGVMNKTGP